MSHKVLITIETKEQANMFGIMCEDGDFDEWFNEEKETGIKEIEDVAVIYESDKPGIEVEVDYAT